MDWGVFWGAVGGISGSVGAVAGVAGFVVNVLQIGRAKFHAPSGQLVDIIFESDNSNLIRKFYVLEIESSLEGSRRWRSAKRLSYLVAWGALFPWGFLALIDEPTTIVRMLTISLGVWGGIFILGIGPYCAKKQRSLFAHAESTERKLYLSDSREDDGVIASPRGAWVKLGRFFSRRPKGRERGSLEELEELDRARKFLD